MLFKSFKHWKRITQLKFNLRYISSVLLLIFVNMISSKLTMESACDSVPGLTTNQQEMCYSEPSVLMAVSAGLSLGDEECRRQFRNHKWNCTNFGEISLFGPQLKIGTREAAFESAIKSSAILYSLVTACSENKLKGCGCNTAGRQQAVPKKRRHIQRNHRNSDVSMVKGWMWGGCSSEIKHSLEYSRKFLDLRKLSSTSARTLMDVHNYESGRKVVTNYLKARCKCHGASGTCATRTCWVIMPSLKELGAALKRKYNKAQKVKAGYYGQKAIYLHVANYKKYLKPKKKGLVYLEDSPLYCDENKEAGIAGTVSRRCNATSKNSSDNCDTMCCGRGYSEQTYTRRWQCDCEFYWCCKVKCHICQENKGRHICN